MKKCTRAFLSLALVLCLILSLFSGVMAAPAATLIVTTPTGYDSASDVVYKTYGAYIANWGARGEDCGFLSTYAQSFYTGSYKYATLSKVSGGTSTSNAPQSTLYSSLQTLMVDNHTTFTKYDSSSGLLCKNLYQYTDCMLGDPSYVSTIYRGYKVQGAWDSGVSYNQEHIWPQSKCLGTASNSDIGDIMQLRAANPSENSSRGNTAFGEGSSYYDPGISVRGDCARTLLYMYVRWGNTGNMWGTEGVIESLDVLLDWIKEDPVDTWEMGHNDAVQSITGTRNVFVDYPEYAYLLFGRSIPADLTTPSTGGDPNANPGGSTGGEGGGTEGSGIATLVTNASSLKAGDQIIIASADYDFAMSTTQNTNNRVQAAVTKSGNTLTYGSDVEVFTLEAGTVSGTFGFRTGAGQYIYAPSSSSNHLKTKATLDDNASWEVSINGSTGVASVTASGSSTRNVMRYNYSSALFSCYAPNNTQLDVAIYCLGNDGGGSGDSGDTGDTGDSGNTGSSVTASMVTGTSSLQAGDRIIIAALDYDFALSTTQAGNNRPHTEVTKSGSTLNAGSDVQIITLKPGVTLGTFAFWVGTDAYLYAASSTANYLRTTDTVEESGSWTISIDRSTGAASITAGEVTRNVMRYNSSSKLFSCYAADNSQKDVAIYKLSSSAPCSHSYTSKVTTAPTCTATGVRTYTCTKCGSSYTESIAKSGHSYSSRVTAPTCTSQGYTTYTCSSCGDTYQSDYTSVTAHRYTTKVTASTCTAQGYTTYTCSTCGSSYKDNYTAVAAHSYTSRVTKAATCTASGIRTYTCSVCSAGYTEPIPATGHSYVYGLCTVCGVADPNCSHSYTSRVTKAATCTTTGIRTYTCSKCGSSYTETISATNHSYSSRVTAPTCTAQGYTTYTCTDCGDSYTGNYTAAAGHSFAGSACTVCGAANPSYVASYYLVGYINGVDYGCEGDWQNMGQYKFVDGKLVATFTQDSYVFIKSEGNAAWYMTKSFCTDTTATFHNTSSGTSEKMFVPGNVQITFTLTENTDDTLTLSYTKAASQVIQPTLTLKAPTLEFKDMITVNAMFTAENIQDVVEMGMITYSSKVSTWNVTNAEHVVSGTTYDATTGRYIAHSQGIHAKYLGDSVYMAVYAKLTDGSYVYSSKLAPYSPVQYATSQLTNSTDTKLKQLCAAMLNYGAEAQLFFGHNTGSLANASLTAAQKALPEAYRADMVSAVPVAPAAKQGTFANNSGFSKRTPSISFEGAFCINYFFTPKYAPTSGITLYYWAEADYQDASVLTTANATGALKLEGSGTGEYRGDVVGISAKNLSQAVYVAAVYQSGGTTWTSGILGYSIGSYCASQASKGVAVSNLAMATAVYGYHAKQYFG